MADYAACSNRQCADRPNCRRGQLADNAPVEVWLLLNHFNRNAAPQLGFDCYTPKEMTCVPATSVPAS